MNFRFWEQEEDRLARLIKPYGLSVLHGGTESCKNCGLRTFYSVCEVEGKVLPLGQTVETNNRIAVYCVRCDAITYDDKPMHLPDFLLIYKPKLHPTAALKEAIARVEETKQDLIKKLEETERFNTSVGVYR